MKNHSRLCELLFCLSLNLFSAPLVLADTFRLQGVITSADGAVSGALVSVLNARQISVASVSSDMSGNFTIDNLTSGTYEILVTAKGFAPRRHAVRLPGDEAVRVEIQLGIQPLTAEVTISADVGTVQELDKTTQQVNVLVESQLQQRAASVLTQAFREEAGLQIQRTSSTIGAVFVRGLTGAKVVTFIDGIRYSNSAALRSARRGCRRWCH